MRTLIILSLLALLPVLTWGQAQRSVVKAFNPLGQRTLVLDLPGEVAILPAPGDLIQIEAEVRISNTTDAVLKALIHAMRYELSAERDTHALLIRPVRDLVPVTVRGVVLDESVRYTVYLPEGMDPAMAVPEAALPH